MLVYIHCLHHAGGILKETTTNLESTEAGQHGAQVYSQNTSLRKFPHQVRTLPIVNFGQPLIHLIHLSTVNISVYALCDY